MTGAKILGAGPAHARIIAELHNRVMGDSWSAESVARLLALPGAFAFIAEAHGQPSGAILCMPGGEGFEIATIIVLPGSRGSGLGGRLLAHALDRAGGVPVELEVREDNEAALGLYRKFGFAEVGRRKDYYPRRAGKGPADAVLMRRTLPTSKP
jgi:ribosomal-protein-alanine N-acetyltransferase